MSYCLPTATSTKLGTKPSAKITKVPTNFENFEMEDTHIVFTYNKVHIHCCTAKSNFYVRRMDLKHFFVT